MCFLHRGVAAADDDDDLVPEERCVSAFDLDTGDFRGLLRTANHRAVSIEGLWGLAFGNGVLGQPTNALFFTAGPGDEAHGLYGRIDPVEGGDDHDED